MSNTVYNTQQYVAFHIDEFLAIIVTSVFAGFMLSFNDWGTTTFDATAGIRALLLMFMLVLFMLLVTIWICKIVAIRLGYTIQYRAHLFGLLFGLVITMASQGYLPIFLPGGFEFKQPERLTIGKFHGYHKGWEVGLIAGTFPLAMLMWVFLFNPLYLASQGEFYLKGILIACLFAIYACIPAPFIERTTKGRMFDVFKYLRGSSFGLDVFFASGAWYMILCVAVIIFALLTWLLTAISVSVGIFIYVLSLILGVISLWVYSRFFKR